MTSHGSLPPQFLDNGPHPDSLGHAALDPAAPDHSRAGAIWVTAVGAFLLFAAAAVFVAVRWQQLGDATKLGIIAALTGGCLLAGRALRGALPATAGVIYHLGAFLIPVNVAAAAVHLGLAWPQFLLVEGLAATVAWTALGWNESSPVLRGAAAGSTVAALAGVTAVLSSGVGWTVPVAVLVALAAVGAEAAGRHGRALFWAVVAGAAPLLALAEQVGIVPVGRGVLDDLGLAGRTPSLAALASALLVAAVLGRNASRRQDEGLVVLAAALVFVGGWATWATVTPTPAANLLCGVALFLAFELAAWTVRDDPFWAGLAKGAASMAETVAVLTLGLASMWAYLPLSSGRSVDGSWIIGGLVAAGAWLVADLRRNAGVRSRTGLGLDLLLGRGWWPATVLATGSVIVGVAMGTDNLSVGSVLIDNRSVVSVVAVALAGLLVISGRPGAHATAAVLVVAAPLTASHPDAVAVGVGLVGALVLAGAAVVRGRMTADPGPAGGPGGVATDSWTAAWALSLAALWTLVETAVVLIPRVPVGGETAVLVGLVGACWVVAPVLDLIPAPWGSVDQLWPAAVLRFGMVLPVVATLAFGDADRIALVAAVAVALTVLDAARRLDPTILATLPITAPIAVGAGALAATGDWGITGVVLTVAAAIAAGAQTLAPSRWQLPLAATAGNCGFIGFLAASGRPSMQATTLIVLGGIGLMYAVAFRQLVLLPFAWALETAGIWMLLAHHGAADLDLYVAPVALALGVAGWWFRERSASVSAGAPAPSGVANNGFDYSWNPNPADVRAASVGVRAVAPISSWVAYAPAVALFGGCALLDRWAGGSGNHALAAGAVAVVAVAVGGARRLVGPLFVGSALIVALTFHESLGMTSQVPTWAWMATGGTLLVAAGLAMERADTGPLETGRRMVDVLSERYR